MLGHEAKVIVYWLNEAYYSGLDGLNTKMIQTEWGDVCRWKLREFPDRDRLGATVLKWIWRVLVCFVKKLRTGICGDWGSRGKTRQSRKMTIKMECMCVRSWCIETKLWNDTSLNLSPSPILSIFINSVIFPSYSRLGMIVVKSNLFLPCPQLP